jgi:hypothetical protein
MCNQKGAEGRDFSTIATLKSTKNEKLHTLVHQKARRQ